MILVADISYVARI